MTVYVVYGFDFGELYHLGLFKTEEEAKRAVLDEFEYYFSDQIICDEWTEEEVNEEIEEIKKQLNEITFTETCNVGKVLYEHSSNDEDYSLCAIEKKELKI